jgi:hypothetical protein
MTTNTPSPDRLNYQSAGETWKKPKKDRDMKRLFQVHDRDGKAHYFATKQEAKAKRDALADGGFKTFVSLGPDHWRTS